LSEAIIDLTASLYDFMVASEEVLDRGRARLADRRHQLSIRAHGLAERFQEARRHMEDDLARKSDDAATQLREMALRLSESRPCVDSLRERWTGLGHSYEALREEIQTGKWEVPKGQRFERVKPQNYWRNLFHLNNGLVSVMLCEVVFTTQNQAILTAACITMLFFGLDLARRILPSFQVFLVNGPVGAIARAHEHHQVPSSTWFALATLLGLLTMPLLAVELGVLVLAVGDPVAAIVGKRWGRTKTRGQKSLEGSLGFVVSSFLVVGALLLTCHPGLSLVTVVTVSLVSGVVGALAEVLTEPIDDNFSIPLFVAFAVMWLL
jgi:dolichol kinase